jgi:alginate O-acetyltransferase complex protein AlgI
MTSINLVLASLFTLVTILATLLVNKQNRWKVLLLTSLIFYYVVVDEKIIVVLILAFVTYQFGQWIHSGKNVTWIAVVLLLIPLLLLKGKTDGNHFVNYRTMDISPDNWFSILQIVGLSYSTFNSISYLVDIKRKYIEPEKNFFFLLLYLLYFPAIFSGPLHRASYLFEQFKNIEVNDHSISRGLRLILWGLFKNVVIAQRLFILMTQLQSSEIGGIYYLFVGLLFFLYLYCNFSSFIDFFQGVSQIFNIRLKNNFKNRVYFSSSRQEFWRGWHITLNQWFKDYFFYAISGYDRKRRCTDILLLITFLLIALWHGFTAVMIVWGVLNGLWIIVEKKFNFKTWRHPSFRKVVGVVYHLSIGSLLALIFISPQPHFLYDKIIVQPSRLPVNFEVYFPSILIILFCLAIMDYHYARAKEITFDEYLDKKPQLLRWFIYFKLAMIILTFGMSAGVENYYIQF